MVLYKAIVQLCQGFGIPDLRFFTPTPTHFSNHEAMVCCVVKIILMLILFNGIILSDNSIQRIRSSTINLYINC